MKLLIWREGDTKAPRPNLYTDNMEELSDAEWVDNLCVPIPKEMPTPRIVADPPYQQFDCADSGDFLVSERMKNLLESFSVVAETVPCEVIQANGKPTNLKYYLFNLLDQVACFDYERSVWDNVEGEVDGIDELVLKEDLAEGHHFFMLGPVPLLGGKIVPGTVFGGIRCVSEELATAILEAGMTNVSFCLPNDFRSYPIQNVAWYPPGFTPPKK